MNRFIPSKYTLFFSACTFFIGCLLASRESVHIFILLPGFVLAFLLLFIYRQKKSAFIFPILIIVLLCGAFDYGEAASRQSSLLQFTGKTAAVEGVVASEPTATDYGFRFVLKNVCTIQKDKIYKCTEKLQVYTAKDKKPSFGDQIRLKAEIEPMAKLRNFGDFDFERYYKSKGITMKAYTQDMVILAHNRAGLLASLMYQSKQKVRNTIFSAMPAKEAALLYGILTGSKSDIDEDVLQVFSLTGLAHILSVSGLHIGFLVLLLTYILKPFKLGPKLQSSVILIVSAFYILLIGAPVPAVRAFLMLSVKLLGSIVGKKYDLNTSTSFAALLLLVYNPLLIHDPSFIISFACMYSICFFHKPVYNLIRPVPSMIRSSLALSAAVWIGITPVLIYYFNYVSFINILLNILAVPMAFLITISGFAAVLAGIVLPSASAFVFAASYYLLKLLYFISEKASLLPFAGIKVPHLNGYITALYYAAALTLIEDFWKYKSVHFRRTYAAAAAALCFIMIVSIMPGSSMNLYFIDVGQGDSSIIRTPENKVIVVDGGGSADWQKSTYDIGEKLTVPALLHLGIWRIDTVIVSHIHDDHLGGVISILGSYKVGHVILPASDRYGKGEFASVNYDRLLALCGEKHIPISYLQSGSVISAGKNVQLKVLAPEKPFIYDTDSDVNNGSLVFKLTYKDFDVLFTGDIQQEAEEKLLDEDIQCDVLKVAHHGSLYSTGESFLKDSDPEISIISVGNNNYGHPAGETIEKLRNHDSRVFRTDISGAIMLTTNGKNLKIRTAR